MGPFASGSCLFLLVNPANESVRGPLLGRSISQSRDRERKRTEALPAGRLDSNTLKRNGGNERHNNGFVTCVTFSKMAGAREREREQEAGGLSASLFPFSNYRPAAPWFRTFTCTPIVAGNRLLLLVRQIRLKRPCCNHMGRLIYQIGHKPQRCSRGLGKYRALTFPSSLIK